MLQFVIDGYNLVHKISKIKESDTPCHNLLSLIYHKKLTGSVNNKVLIVFDGRKPPYNIIDFQYKVLFSGNRSADDLIIDEIKRAKNKKQIVVVSDDQELGRKAKMLEAKVRRVDSFISGKQKSRQDTNKKEIKYSIQREITEELRKIWLDE